MDHHQQQQQDSNRLRLNFPLGNQQNFDAANARLYPTTPSTFPQPIYGTQQQDFGSMLSPVTNPQQGYFMNTPTSYQNQQQ
jgi:protein-serine/threonine kinase